MITDSLQYGLAERLWATVAPGAERPALEVTGPVTLDSAFAVSELAAAAIGVAGMAAATVAGHGDVRVDRALASAWFGTAVRRPNAPSPWDALAGDYRCRDGWIRLHTNAPHHRDAALRVLGVAPGEVRDTVAQWGAEELETAIVAAGGCAAVMRTFEEWMRHPQGAAVAAEPLVAWTPGRAGAASGIRGARVLDLTRVIAGPVATRFLAGLGADVLRIDPPDWDEPAVAPDMTLGKRAARLDAKADPAALRALIAQADVVVHGYRADALDWLGDLDDIRPGVIEVAIDAYGWTGPWRNRRGFDSLVQMSAGIADEGMRWFRRDVPTPLPVQALDHSTGYLAAAAALVGIASRRETGSGCRARLSLARTALELTGAGRGDAAMEAPVVPTIALHTPWGAAELVESPVTIDGEPLRWDRGPRPLGSDAAEF